MRLRGGEGVGKKRKEKKRRDCEALAKGHGAELKFHDSASSVPHEHILGTVMHLTLVFSKT